MTTLIDVLKYVNKDGSLPFEFTDLTMDLNIDHAKNKEMIAVDEL